MLRLTFLGTAGISRSFVAGSRTVSNRMTLRNAHAVGHALSSPQVRSALRAPGGLRNPMTRLGETSARRRINPSTASPTEVSRSSSEVSNESKEVHPHRLRKLTRPRIFLRNWYSSVDR